MDIDRVSASPSPDNTMQRELFVVQRCWHSGPQQYQPLDLLRLFITQRDAEEAAYHSAHAWCRYHKPNAEPQVKTLLLPSYPAHNASGSSYGFVAHGSLFWVRSLYAVTSATASGAASSGDPGFHPTEGYAVVTEGVIGGTGNRMSRRGTEIPHGRVFVPEAGNRTMMMMVPVNSYAAAEVMRRKALETCHYVMAQLGSNISVSVATLPIGRPTEYTSGNFLKDWPPQVLQPNLLLAHDPNDHKRMAPPPSLNDTMRTVSEEFPSGSDDEGIIVDCPFELPAAKRRRYCDDTTPFQPIPYTENNVSMSF